LAGAPRYSVAKDLSDGGPGDNWGSDRNPMVFHLFQEKTHFFMGKHDIIWLVVLTLEKY
jgi:hypothetical protein